MRASFRDHPLHALCQFWLVFLFYGREGRLAGPIAPTFLIAIPSTCLAINRLRKWGSAREFQGGGEIDAVEGVTLAIRKVGGPPVSQLCSTELYRNFQDWPLLFHTLIFVLLKKILHSRRSTEKSWLTSRRSGNSIHCFRDMVAKECVFVCEGEGRIEKKKKRQKQ